ncbi:MAG: S41 family peptidase [Gammaproteobacteria bacterium]|nr:S41 family peptidase [Gammaproteobacteria bacterium]
MSLRARSVLVLVIGTVLGLSLSFGGGVLAERGGPETDETLPWEEARLLAEVLQRVKRDYVEQVDDHDLIEAAIRGMVADLDPHSAFLDSDEYEEIRISTTGNYTGVGLEVSLEEAEDGQSKQVRVIAPIDDTPADRAGIRSGDAIISIDGMPVDPENLGDTVNRMRGESGTQVRIAIMRSGVAEPLSFTLTRDHVLVRSVKHEMLEPGYGYIRITHFSETTARDLDEALAVLQRQSEDGLRGLILDLRNNPGGVLDSAVDVSDAFLDEGTIVTADGRVSEARFSMEAKAGDALRGEDLVVLVNSGSASASEIVAGALQDNHRALLVGSATYGKGSVQTVMPLSQGRAIKLTTSKYYTPSGTSIHERGIVPDIRIENDDMDAAQIAQLPELEGHQGLAKDYELRAALQALQDKRIAHIPTGADRQ